MKNDQGPNPNTVHPVAGYENEIYIKPKVQNPNIIAGEFSYIADADFESHVTHHYPWIGDKLIIGKFCQIAAGVEFMMNGANHQMNAVSTFPFYTLEGWDMRPPAGGDLPYKGDTVIGSDVWIGQNARILPGVHIGDGAIIGANSVVGSNIEPYTIAVGNPAKPLRKRFDDEMIRLLLDWRWWDLPTEEINRLIPVLTSSDLGAVKAEIRAQLAARENTARTAQIRRIEEHEALMREAEQLLNASDDPGDPAALQAVMQRLEAYYTSDDWKRDFADDEAGLLPRELRRGVLSEDGIFNLLEAYRARTAQAPTAE